MRARALQSGITTLEFAIVGVAFFMILFGVLEVGRLIYTLNMLQEGTRRAARVAAICSWQHPAVAEKALFANLPGLGTSNIQVEYLNETGGVAATFGEISYVRVSIIQYAIPLAIPFINLTIDAPAFPSTLPRESLGVVKFGAAPEC